MEINVTELHQRLLNMAKVFHEICVENDISYYMLGGTMLGAVRHQGFIPWDDDMDFGIPREDYDKFISLPKTAFPKELELRFYLNTPESPMHYVKLVDNRTTLIENGYRNYKEGLYIDVFPLDGVDMETLSDKIMIKRIFFKQYMIMNHCSTVGRKGFFKVLFKGYCEIRNIDKLHDSLEKMMTRHQFSESKYVGNYLGAWGQKEIMPKEIMGKPILYKFEDTELYGSENSDKYLTNLYGDYMKLPPKEKRVFKHNFYLLDYNIPFREYSITINNNKI